MINVTKLGHHSSFRSPPATRSVIPFLATGFRLLKGPRQFFNPLLHANFSFTASRRLRRSASPKLSMHTTFHIFESHLRGVVVVLAHLVLHTAIITAPTGITAVYTFHLFYFDDFGNLTIIELPGPDGKVPGAFVNTLMNWPLGEERDRALDEPESVPGPAKKGVTTVAMAASANPILADEAVRDPPQFCTGLK
ncbi:hypothetical protein EDB89DRAFT_2144156 [Lactarius sanguifluus]|nr:hypothetical protein EDB89DRAFT_2144156 [Lactarius sanguifluus]